MVPILLQLFSEGYNDSGNSRINQQGNDGEIPDVMVQNHNLTSNNLNSYSAFGTSESHVHHSVSSTSSPLEFHHQQLLNSSNGRNKELQLGTGHRTTHQSSAAAVAAAMMLDPR